MLSKKQFEEVQKELAYFDKEVELIPFWASSPGDRDRSISLKEVEKTDFFTKDLDELLLSGKIDAAVHSAKDVPLPLRKGLEIAAITRGVDRSAFYDAKTADIASSKSTI